MKKILAALLVVALVTPTFALAVDEILPTSAPRPGTGSTQDVLSNTGPNASAGIANLAAAGDVVGCQTGGFGGALAQTFGAALQQAIPGFIRGQLGGALNKLASQAGPFAPVVNAIGNIAINKLSTFLQGKIGELLGGGAGGIVNDALGAVTGGIGAGIGLAAGVPGVAEPSVPTRETGQVKTDVGATRKATEERLVPDARRTAEATETSAQAKCVGDPLINKLKNAILSLLFKSTIDFMNSGFDGDTALIQNLRQFLFEGVQAVTEDFIENQLSGLCTTQKQPVQVLLLTQYQYETNFGKQSQCGAQDSALEQKRRGGGDYSLFAESAFDSSLSDFGSFYNAYNALTKQQAAQTDSNLTRSGVDGLYKDKIKCEDGSTAVGGYCPGNAGFVTASADLFKNELHETLNQPREQLLNADEIGELIDALTASVSQVALQGIDGLMGLSQKSGNQGSYLDDMVNSATGIAQGSAQDAVASDIEAALVIEETYLDTLNVVISSLTETRAVYTQAVQCYKQKSTSGTNSALALQKMNNASSTIATVIDPQITSLLRTRTDSEDAVDALTILIVEAESALTTEDIISVNDRFTTLTQSGIVHTSTDLTFLQNSFDSAIDSLNLLRTDATTQLAECQVL